MSVYFQCAFESFRGNLPADIVELKTLPQVRSEYSPKSSIVEVPLKSDV